MKIKTKTLKNEKLRQYFVAYQYFTSFSLMSDIHGSHKWILVVRQSTSPPKKCLSRCPLMTQHFLDFQRLDP